MGLFELQSGPYTFKAPQDRLPAPNRNRLTLEIDPHTCALSPHHRPTHHQTESPSLTIRQTADSLSLKNREADREFPCYSLHRANLSLRARQKPSDLSVGANPKRDGVRTLRQQFFRVVRPERFAPQSDQGHRGAELTTPKIDSLLEPRPTMTHILSICKATALG